MCQLCREVSQTTCYSCGHEKTRTVKVPEILFWHKERKKVTLRKKYARRKLCRDCGSSSRKIKDKRKEVQGGNGKEEVPSTATGALIANENGDGGDTPAPAADAGSEDAGDANPQGQQDNNDANAGGAGAVQGNDADRNDEGAAAQ